MNSTTPPTILAPPSAGAGRRIAARRRPSASSDRLTWGDVFNERTSTLGAPAFFGPPVIFVLGPWLLLVFLLIGPLVLAMMAVLALAVGAGLLAVSAAVIASPYLLIGHLRTRGIAHPSSPAPLHLFRTRRIGSGRLGSPQPKGF
ncbi:MAG TPA: hypothetical protein VFW09_03855 [Solirubrobacteraceae bacterium]|nr:hypothetical protein [Solirubrobacteraceae bacterium]